MARGIRPDIGSFLSPSTAPVPMPAEPVKTGAELVAAFFALHPDRWFTCEEVAASTGFERSPSSQARGSRPRPRRSRRASCRGGRARSPAR